MAKWIEGFEFRGRPPGSPLPIAWQLTVGVVVPDGFGGEVPVIKGPLTPEQAAELGYSLGSVLAVINAETLIECDRLRKALAESEEKRMALMRRIQKEDDARLGGDRHH